MRVAIIIHSVRVIDFILFAECASISINAFIIQTGSVCFARRIWWWNAGRAGRPRQNGADAAPTALGPAYYSLCNTTLLPLVYRLPNRRRFNPVFLLIAHSACVQYYLGVFYSFVAYLEMTAFPKRSVMDGLRC